MQSIITSSNIVKRILLTTRIFDKTEHEKLLVVSPSYRVGRLKLSFKNNLSNTGKFKSYLYQYKI